MALPAPAGLLYVVDTGNNTLVDTINVPQQAQSSDFLALNADSDRLYYTSASGVVSVDTKTKELVAIRVFAGTATPLNATGLAYDSARQRLYILDRSGLMAVHASQIDTPSSPLPGTGGPPASPSASRWMFLGGLLAAIGCLMLWRSFRGIRF
jgi:DNA-binding beta-propeller fold protein YncE